MKGSVRKRGKIWYYSYDAGKNSKGKRTRIEKMGTESKRETESMLRAEIEKYEKMKNFNDSSFLKILENYYRTVKKDLKIRTIELYKSNFKKIKQVINEDEFISEIDVIRIIEKLKTITTNYSINRIICLIKRVYEYAYINKHINFETYNNIKMIKPLKVTRKEEKVYFDIKELEKKIEKIITNKNIIKIIKVMFYAGLRIGETCALTWDDIDFENRILTINKNIPSGYSKLINLSPKTTVGLRKIFINDKLLKIFEELKLLKENLDNETKEKNKNYLVKDKQTKDLYHIVKYKTELEIRFIFITKNNNCYTKDSLRYSLDKIKKEIPNFSYHCGRVSHATDLINKKISLKIIQERLGHSNIKTTLDIYNKITEKERKKSENILNKM